MWLGEREGCAVSVGASDGLRVFVGAGVAVGDAVGLCVEHVLPAGNT